MIHIVTIFMVTMQGGSWSPNKTNKVKKKTGGSKFRFSFTIPINVKKQRF